MKTLCQYAIATILFSALGMASYAHGPQIQITREGDTIVTREIVLDGPYNTLTPPKSAYVMPVLQFNGAWYTRANAATDALGLPLYYSGPGLAYGLGQTFEVGSTLGLSFSAGLRKWDGASFVDASATQLEAFRGSNASPSAVARTTDSAPFGSLTLNALETGYDDEAHGTIRYRLLEESSPSNVESPDGVYLATLKITSTQAGVLPSSDIHFVLHKNAAANDLTSAILSLNLPAQSIQYVPEPFATGLVFAVLGMVCLRKRSTTLRTAA